jgi:uncharacterized protein DUF6894
VQNGPGPFNGFVRTLEDAKAEFAASWGAWLKAAGLNEDTPTAQLRADYSNLTEARKHALETFGILIHDQADAGPFADASMLVTDADGSPLFTLRFLVEEH